MLWPASCHTGQTAWGDQPASMLSLPNDNEYCQACLLRCMIATHCCCAAVIPSTTAHCCCTDAYCCCPAGHYCQLLPSAGHCCLLLLPSRALLPIAADGHCRLLILLLPSRALPPIAAAQPGTATYCCRPAGHRCLLPPPSRALLPIAAAQPGTAAYCRRPAGHCCLLPPPSRALLPIAAAHVPIPIAASQPGTTCLAAYLLLPSQPNAAAQQGTAAYCCRTAGQSLPLNAGTAAHYKCPMLRPTAIFPPPQGLAKASQV